MIFLINPELDGLTIAQLDPEQCEKWFSTFFQNQKKELLPTLKKFLNTNKDKYDFYSVSAQGRAFLFLRSKWRYEDWIEKGFDAKLYFLNIDSTIFFPILLAKYERYVIINESERTSQIRLRNCPFSNY